MMTVEENKAIFLSNDEHHDNILELIRISLSDNIYPPIINKQHNEKRTSFLNTEYDYK